MKNKYLTIKEFGRIYRSENIDRKEAVDLKDGNIELPGKDYDDIKQFILTCKEDENSDKPIDYLQPDYDKKRECFKAKNFVGVIQTNSGITIEILPKIYFAQSEAGKEQDEIVRTRKIFLKMLKTLKNSPFKKLSLSSLKSDKFPLFEIFIQMFIEELFDLVHHGIKSGYVSKESNENFLKGKLKLKENIKYNFVHKERFFICYDEFLQDRPENRLLKTTVAFLLKLSKAYSNQAKLRQLSNILDEISISKNIVDDFSNVKINRLNKEYEILLKWCKIFLNHRSFTSFKGESVAFALLFPMERIFESYVASVIKKDNTDWNVKPQDNKFHLINSPKKSFCLKPDIVMRKDRAETIILDTKWKNLNNQSSNLGISQSDMYQMFAYGKQYTTNQERVREMLLIFPFNDNFNSTERIQNPENWKCNDCICIQEYQYDSNLSLKILLWRFD